MKTQILKWKDGKKAPFLLAFDDGAPTHLDIVVPALENRQIVGTFYLNPGTTHFQARRVEWERAATSDFVALANHTFTHKGATTVHELEEEVEKCHVAIRDLTPHQNWPRIVAFGRPGGVPWTISETETDQVLNRFHLVRRPPFRSPRPMEQAHETTSDALRAIVDEALQSGEATQAGFHGVGGDWHSTPLECFAALLDKLKAHRHEMWFCDMASCHKYQTEREGATLEVHQQNGAEVILQLGCQTELPFYDFPLSLVVGVPSVWKECVVVQGAKQSRIKAHQGLAHCEVLPISGKIVVRQVSQG